MTPEQFERWQDFAVRMARTCFEASTEPAAAWIESEVKDFFWRLDEGDVVTFESWDNSAEYPRETGYFDRNGRCPCRWDRSKPPPCPRHDGWSRAYGILKPVVKFLHPIHRSEEPSVFSTRPSSYSDWSSRFAMDGGWWDATVEPECTCKASRPHGPGLPDPDCEKCGGDHSWRRMSTGPLTCDIMSELESEAFPGTPGCAFCRRPDGYEAKWAAERAGLDKAAAKSYAAWRSEAWRNWTVSDDAGSWHSRRQQWYEWWFKCTCDDDEQDAYERWGDQWYGPVRCCVRAGIDFASEPSAGVVGFTAGDVRRMYPEGVPDWVFPPDEKLHYWLSDSINGTFPELSDEAGVLL